MAVVVWKDEEIGVMLAHYPDMATTNQWPAMLEIVMEAQKKLPKARRRTRHSITLTVRQRLPKFKAQIKRALQLLAKQDGQAAANSEDDVPTKAPKQRLANVHWLALAHDGEVKPLLDSKVEFNRDTLVDALMRAQKRVLPVDKRRSRESWTHAFYTKGEALTPGGVPIPLRKLREAMRFPPLAEPLVPPPPVPQPRAAAQPTTPLAPVMEMLKTSEAEQLVKQGVLVESLAALKGEMDALMVKALTVLGNVMLDAFKPTMEETMKKALATQAEQVTEGMRRAIEELLGGPSPAAASAPAAAPVVEAKPDPKPSRLAIDIVGLTGPCVDVVVQAFKDLAYLDLRFVNNHNTAGTDYRSNVILVKKFVSHTAEARVRSQAKRFIRVSGAAQSVITAVEALVSEQKQVALH